MSQKPVKFVDYLMLAFYGVLLVVFAKSLISMIVLLFHKMF